MFFASFPPPLSLAFRLLLYTLSALLLVSPLYFIYDFSLPIKKKKLNQTIHLCPKPSFLKTTKRNSQLYGHMPSLYLVCKNTFPLALFNLESNASFAIRIASNICLPPTRHSECWIPLFQCSLFY